MDHYNEYRSFGFGRVYEKNVEFSSMMNFNIVYRIFGPCLTLNERLKYIGKQEIVDFDMPFSRLKDIIR